MKFKNKLAIAILSMLAINSVSIAGTDSATLSVSTNAITGCSFGTPSYSLSFGNYDGSADVTRSVQVDFDCATDNVIFHLEADLGANDDGSSRRVTDGNGNYLSYGLFQDASHTLPLGTVAGGNDISNTTGLAGIPTTIDIYGKIPSGQAIGAAGTYSDTVNLTLNF